MISIHTFQIQMYLDKKKYKEIKRKLGVPSKRNSWTEHRYSNWGINIKIHKTGKNFIYLRYVVNPQRIIKPKDYLHLFNPTVENVAKVWEVIKRTWEEIGCGEPFEGFYLSRIDFTYDFYADSEEMVKEYIRLLSKCILVPSDRKCTVDGIFHLNKDAETKADMGENCSKFEITQSESIQIYNKMYQLENEKIPVDGQGEDAGRHILRVELQVKRKQIQKWIQQVEELKGTSVEMQLGCFAMNARAFFISRIEKLYKPGKFYHMADIKQLIAGTGSLRKKSKQYAMELVEGCNRNISLGRCLEIDRQKGSQKKYNKILGYLSSHGISPVCIKPKLKGYKTLPDIFENIW